MKVGLRDRMDVGLRDRMDRLVNRSPERDEVWYLIK